MRALHWFRSDLRLRDNTALAAAVARADELACVFVLDERLLRGSGVGPPRLRFMRDALESLSAELAKRGHRLLFRQGDPAREIPKLVKQARARILSFNRDPGPYARRRDHEVRTSVEKAGAEVLACKDRVLFESGEVRTKKGEPFRVFTPFRNVWRAKLREEGVQPGRAPLLPAPIPGLAAGRLPGLAALGAAGDRTEIPRAGASAAQRRLGRFLDGPIGAYAKARDLPALDGTSRLSPYLRWGVISPRVCVEAALDVVAREPRQAEGAGKWLDELVWREFYSAILEEHPHVLRRAFRDEFAGVRWDDDETRFRAWCEGRTGYPFVDAAMRQLARTGWMHNRARMVVASFLTKDLLIDWRWGEAFFMQRLVDGDPASNNGGWQWSASTGTDAQPYFRIFNPVSQGERFDAEGVYVQRFVPELERVSARFLHQPWLAPSPPSGYPKPIVDHAAQRRVALDRYEKARSRARR